MTRTGAIRARSTSPARAVSGCRALRILFFILRQVSSFSAPRMGLAWNEYDEQFYRARELFPREYKWGESDTNSPIWLNDTGRGIASVSTGQIPGRSGARSFQPLCLSTVPEAACAVTAATSTPVVSAAETTALCDALPSTPCAASGRGPRAPPSRLLGNVSLPTGIVPAVRVPPAALRGLLWGYDENVASFLVDGFENGFSVGCLGLPPSDMQPNLPSSDLHPK